MFRLLTASLVVFYMRIHVDSAPLKNDYTESEIGGFIDFHNEAGDEANTHERGQEPVFGSLSFDDNSDGWELDEEQDKSNWASAMALNGKSFDDSSKSYGNGNFYNFFDDEKSDTSGENSFFGDFAPIAGAGQFQPSSKNSSANDQSGFSTDTKDCANINAKSCYSDGDCSCYGLYMCISEKCKMPTPAKQSTEHAGGIWGEPFNPESLGGVVDGDIYDGTEGPTSKQSLTHAWGFIAKK